MGMFQEGGISGGGDRVCCLRARAAQRLDKILSPDEENPETNATARRVTAPFQPRKARKRPSGRHGKRLKTCNEKKWKKIFPLAHVQRFVIC